MLQADQILQDRYQLKQQLGQNANRQTWLAEDLAAPEVDRRVVVKLLPFGGQVQWDDLKLFEREAQVLKQLDHPRIPRYRDYFSLDDRILWFGLVQQYIPGISLKDSLTQGERYSEEEVRQIAVNVLNILIYLHEQNPPVLHRDIKPSNLILGEDNYIYLVDFGAVQDRAATEGATFTVVGTYGYAPMEQFGGRAVPASDLYALGATLIHLLTGVSPADLPQRELRIQFRDRVTLSPTLSRWIEDLTEPVLERRLSSARQALDYLQTRRSLTPLAATVEQPPNSRVQLLKSEAELRIDVPAKRLTAWRLIWVLIKLLIGIALLPIGVFTLILIFPIVGFLNGPIGELKAAYRSYSVHFDRKHFRLEWRLFGWRYRRDEGKIKEILAVFQSVIEKSNGSFQLGPAMIEEEIVNIQTRSHRYSFGRDLDGVHCLWLSREIKDWLRLYGDT